MQKGSETVENRSQTNLGMQQHQLEGLCKFWFQCLADVHLGLALNNQGLIWLFDPEDQFQDASETKMN